jgi:chromate reductase
MAKSRIAIIVGSNRRDSINRKLARALAKLGADKFDARFVRIDDLPMFNQDLEGNLPEEAVRFKSENAVDWGARPYGKNSWAGKPGFITGTSPGAIGSALAQQHLRSVMVGLGMILLGGEAYVTFKPNLVDEDGNITDENTRKFLQGFLDRFISLVVRLSQPDPH